MPLAFRPPLECPRGHDYRAAGYIASFRPCACDNAVQRPERGHYVLRCEQCRAEGNNEALITPPCTGERPLPGGTQPSGPGA